MFSPGSAALEVAGVVLPVTLQIPDNTTPLLLNGAGTRNKFFFKIYVAGLYLPSTQTTPAAILDLTGPKRVHMHFLYKEVEQEKLITGWRDGFKNNLEKASFEQLAPRLAKFNSLFRTMKRGEAIDLDYLPKKGTRVWINGKLHGQIAGADFYTALLKVWLGESPADAKLKAALLKGKAD
ncbi:MAG: chalcone isomerase family protein [Halobacteria archaeon]|nr:chalcone isomerase family protein [Halobacteria archaeon]